jgi:Alpha/beta hydrolase domain
MPEFGSFGFQKLFDKDTLSALYKDHTDSVARFNRRLDELVDEGWFLAEDAGDLRSAPKADVP